MSGTGMISDGFSIPDARADHWAQAAIVGRAWAAAVARGEDAGKLCDAARSALAEIVTLEDFFAFPGLRLMQTLQERLRNFCRHRSITRTVTAPISRY